MISKEDILKLANLSRIELKESEVEKLQGEIGDILEYVGQIKDSVGEMGEKVEFGNTYNVLREDDNATESGTYSQGIVTEFPEQKEGRLKVKKIL